ncbi:MAG: RluA family pseudouridine synthase [Nitrospirae bacterium]|nr:RluA family pseudouridine synthase [Nitrospirota bacterium]
MKNLALKTTVESDSRQSAPDFLAEKTGLSKSRVKDAMNKGAVWIKKRKGGLERLRRALTPLKKGDHIELYYDEKLLGLTPPEAICLSDERQYSVWYKPPGLLAQGTKYGDHCSLMRQAELFFKRQRQIFLIHRLDREASGLMLLAHSRDAAARLSGLFQRNEIIKRYMAEVIGNPGAGGKRGVIEFPLDGKAALTEFEVLSYDHERNISEVSVIIKTGRLHQIRRHFAMAGFPVMGDPEYGEGNKNKEGMKLFALSLRFVCPFRKKEVLFELPEDLIK